MFPSPKTHELLPYKSSLLSKWQQYSMTAEERELETESMQNVKLKVSFKTEKEPWVSVLLFKKFLPSAFNFHLVSSIFWCWKNTQDQSQNKEKSWSYWYTYHFWKQKFTRIWIHLGGWKIFIFFKCFSKVNFQCVWPVSFTKIDTCMFDWNPTQLLSTFFHCCTVVWYSHHCWL